MWRRMAGVARENASRVISRWLRAGILSRVRGYYVIENPAALLEGNRRRLRSTVLALDQPCRDLGHQLAVDICEGKSQIGVPDRGRTCCPRQAEQIVPRASR